MRIEIRSQIYEIPLTQSLSATNTKYKELKSLLIRCCLNLARLDAGIDIGDESKSVDEREWSVGPLLILGKGEVSTPMIVQSLSAVSAYAALQRHRTTNRRY